MKEQITSTIVKCRCTSKKQSDMWQQGKLNHEIELSVPYDQSSIYYQQSGGTGFVLKTINQDAADMFVIGESYDVLISPSAKEVKQEEPASPGPTQAG